MAPLRPVLWPGGLRVLGGRRARPRRKAADAGQGGGRWGGGWPWPTVLRRGGQRRPGRPRRAAEARPKTPPRPVLRLLVLGPHSTPRPGLVQVARCHCGREAWPCRWLESSRGCRLALESHAAGIAGSCPRRRHTLRRAGNAGRAWAASGPRGRGAQGCWVHGAGWPRGCGDRASGEVHGGDTARVGVVWSRGWRGRTELAGRWGPLEHRVILPRGKSQGHCALRGRGDGGPLSAQEAELGHI